MVRSGLLVQSGSARFTTFQDVKLYIMKLVSTFRFLHFLNFRAKIKDSFERMTLDNLKIVVDDRFIFSQYFSEIILHYFRLKTKLT